MTLCKYCEQLYPVEELLHKMTLKSIIQTDRHLMVFRSLFLKILSIFSIEEKPLNGWRDQKSCKWILLLFYKNIKFVKAGNYLFDCWEVSKWISYKLHQETERLRQIEFELAQSLGIPVHPEKRPDLVSVTGFSSSDPANNIALMNQALNIQAANSPTNNESWFF